MQWYGIIDDAQVDQISVSANTTCRSQENDEKTRDIQMGR